MGKVWILDTETKGTGASMVPIEKAQKKVQARKPAPRRPKPAASQARPRTRTREQDAGKTSSAHRPGHGPNTSSGHPPAHGRKASSARAPAEVRKTSTPLPPGHVRKKGTGEIGRVQSVDPQAGTARVRWLKGGSVSTVPLTAVSRR